MKLSIGGKSLSEIAAKAKARAAAEEERAARLLTDAKRRRIVREASAEAESGEHRRGSHLRRQYTFKEKKRILAVFDEINSDPAQLQKVATFHADPRARSTPYTTVRTHWASVEQRANIEKGANREYGNSLLRFDTKSRKVGRFAAMETELFTLLKARRARGRKVSARWLTATGRQLVSRLHAQQLARFKGVARTGGDASQNASTWA